MKLVKTILVSLMFSGLLLFTACDNDSDDVVPEVPIPENPIEIVPEPENPIENLDAE